MEEATQSVQDTTNTDKSTILTQTDEPTTDVKAEEVEVKQEVETKSKPEERIIPEKYELKLSEDSRLSAEALEEISEYAKQKGLTNEEAQDVLSRDEKVVQGFVSRNQAQFEQVQSDWVNQIKQDSEIGGDRFNESVVAAKSVVDRFGSEEFRQELNESGYGNHPGLVRLFAKVGRAMANDKFVHGGASVVEEPPQSHENILYPETKT